MSNKILILGGARSGKSRYAQQRAEDIFDCHKKQLIYLATAVAGDSEMAQRIQHHQADRDPSIWTTHEETLNLTAALEQYNQANYCVLVDCLTLWLNNCLSEDCWQLQRDQLLAYLPKYRADIIFVSNEVGSGIVPLGQLSREFADQSGWLHQQLAQLCNEAKLIVAGLPLTLK